MLGDKLMIVAVQMKQVAAESYFKKLEFCASLVTF